MLPTQMMQIRAGTKTWTCGLLCNNGGWRYYVLVEHCSFLLVAQTMRGEFQRPLLRMLDFQRSFNLVQPAVGG